MPASAAPEVADRVPPVCTVPSKSLRSPSSRSTSAITVPAPGTFSVTLSGVLLCASAAAAKVTIPATPVSDTSSGVVVTAEAVAWNVTTPGASGYS